MTGTHISEINNLLSILGALTTRENIAKEQIVKVAQRRHVGMSAAIASALLLVCTGPSAACAEHAESDDQPTKPPKWSITDKTMVAWVQLANLEQQAGSALTLIDEQERFDAIVFAERAPRKWMAGSDVFRRTPSDQSAYPAETADAKTLVQMAVVYDREAIRIYRNGTPYASYQIDQPQSFSQYVTVLLGLRYVGGMGEIGFLAGAIEEARLYDAALDAEAIAGLKPNQPSDPKPIAQWTFEDGTASDTIGTFPVGELRGHARIDDGKLHLDGKDSYVEIGWPRPVPPPCIFYKARSRQTGNMWDTWLYLHEGTYYLYYLANSGPRWNNVSMASSSDGVHWKEIGRILSKDPDAVWMGTGSTWKSPNFEKDGKFYINFSQQFPDQPQTIFFGESTDLVSWKWLDVATHEFKQDTRWYQPDGRWDCIYTIPRPGGGLFGYWTATPKPETGGRFGFGESLDGAKWKALPPPETPGVGGGEAGAVEKIGQKYYMMFGNHGMMITLVADKPQGPFLPAKKNLRLLSGHTYFSRFFPTPDGVLVNHHSIARNGQVYFGLLKSTMIDEEGTLRLGWWKNNEKLKHQAVEVQVPAGDGQRSGPIAMLGNTFDTERGVILEGSLRLPKNEDSPRVGLYIAWGSDQGSAILLNSRGVTELGPIGPDGTGFKMEKQVNREMSFRQPAAFRLLLAHSLLEFYLDDVLIECFSLPDNATGRIGLIGDVSKLKAWEAR
jgi:hypothetical protein